MWLPSSITVTLTILLAQVARATLWCQDIDSGSLNIRKILGNGTVIEEYPLGELSLSDGTGNHYLGVNYTYRRHFTFSACDSVAIDWPGILGDGHGLADVFGKIRWSHNTPGRTEAGCLTWNQDGAIVFGQCAMVGGP